MEPVKRHGDGDDKCFAVEDVSLRKCNLFGKCDGPLPSPCPFRGSVV